MNDNETWIAAATADINSTWITAEDVNVNESLSNVSSVNDSDVDKQWAKVFLEGCRFWIPSVLLPLVVTVGIMGNVVTVIVMTRKRMKSSTNTYLTALAVSDLLFLIFNMILSFEHQPAIRQSQYVTYWHLHKWTIWLVDATGACSNWLTVSFTLERYIAVKHPLRGKVLCTESRARKVIALVILLACLLTITTAFEWNVDVIDGKVALQSTWLGQHPTYKSVFYWFSSITVTAIPLASLSVLNYLLVAAVRRSTKGRNQLTEDARGVRGSFRPTCNAGNSIYSRCGSERSPPIHGMSQRRVLKERQENKVTIVLISVVFLFLICQAPSAITVIVKVFYEPESDTSGDYLLRSAGNICNFLMVINAASNFFLYCALSDTYQRTLTTTFCRRERRWNERNDTLSTAASFRNSSVKQLRHENETQ
ncbi:probable G-protein coupled receptor 139 [Rhodnius prolixus]